MEFKLEKLFFRIKIEKGYIYTLYLCKGSEMVYVTESHYHKDWFIRRIKQIKERYRLFPHLSINELSFF